MIIVLVLISVNMYAQEVSEVQQQVQQQVEQPVNILTYGELSFQLRSVVSASYSLDNAMSIYRDNNSKRKVIGFRIRIFFDNKQQARELSSQVVEEFKLLYPEVGVYRKYENPYFKVTVGDFRTKSEAMKFLHEVKKLYPAAFIVKGEL